MLRDQPVYLRLFEAILSDIFRQLDHLLHQVVKSVRTANFQRP